MQIDETRYRAIMQAWAEWSCTGRLLVRGYPPTSAHVNERVDNLQGSGIPVGEFPDFEKIDVFVRHLAQHNTRLAKVLIVYWEAQPRFEHLARPVKARRLGVSESTFGNEANIANHCLQVIMAQHRFQRVARTGQRVAAV